MTTYTGQTRMTLGQLCAALWDSQSRAGCDTDWVSNQGVCSDASSTEMQCLRPLRQNILMLCFNVNETKELYDQVLGHGTPFLTEFSNNFLSIRVHK